MPPMPAEAEAPPDLVTPSTASAAPSARLARSSRTATLGRSGSSRSRSGTVARQPGGIGQAGERILGRRPCHGNRALGELRYVGLDVVGRHHRLAASDEYAQPHVVALGALGFLHRALAHLDRKRHRAHGERIGRVGAGAAGSGDEPLGEVGQRGLIEERGLCFGGHGDGITLYCFVGRGACCEQSERMRQGLVKHVAHSTP